MFSFCWINQTCLSSCDRACLVWPLQHNQLYLSFTLSGLATGSGNTSHPVPISVRRHILSSLVVAWVKAWGRYYRVRNDIWTGVNHSSEIKSLIYCPSPERGRARRTRKEIKTSIITSWQGFVPSYLSSFWCPSQCFSFLCDREGWNYSSARLPRPQRQFVGGLRVLCMLSFQTQSTRTTLWFGRIQYVKGVTISITPHHISGSSRNNSWTQRWHITF